MHTTDPTSTDADHSATASTAAWLLSLLIPSLAAAAVAGYLAFASWSSTGRPIGCGPGSGCDEVLSSPWSRVVGVPVGIPAAVLYLAIAAAAPGAVTAAGCGRKLLLSRGLWLATGAILAAVSWFVGLQTIELQVFCPWCLADHALGVVTVLAVLLNELRQRRFQPLWFVIGMGLTALLAFAQILWPGPAAAPAALDARQVELLAGRLQLDLAEVPTLGASEGAQPVVLLFDYCCPHCRQTHEQLMQIQQAHPGRFSVVLLPVPLNADCNPRVEETEPRFQSACELARLSLAVWRVAPERFAEYDRWLFSSEQPRTAVEAREQAEQLASTAVLETSLAADWIAARIAQNVQAFQASEVESIPVLLTPGQGGASGRVESRDALEAVLRDQLHVTLD